MEIKLIAFDLDGTALREDKTLSKQNRAALQAAADRGIYIVPATGRIFPAIPEQVMALEQIRYTVCINGASVYDRQQQEVLYRAEIPLQQALDLFAYIDRLPVIYDCYADDTGWASAEHYALAERYIFTGPMQDLFRRTRQAVPNLADFIRQRGKSVQKLQMYFREPGNRKEIIQELNQRFPDILVSSSLSNNLELNWKEAGKDTALRVLCQRLGIEMSQVMALGDGSNDIGMLEAAGIGIAMANATQRVRRAADCVTDDNESDGLARAIARYCL